MSRHFKTIRTPVVIEVGGESHTFFLRELGYLHFLEINRSAGAGLSKEDRGFAIMEAVALASIEEDDGKPSYTAEEWRNERKEVVAPLSKAAMKAQGIDIEKEIDRLTEAEALGNGRPSRKSGTN